MPIIGAILGATGSGKTSLAVLLAEKLNAQIICMDSRQVFKNFRIGTSQPSEKELKTVVHHLVDFLPPEASYNAAEFMRDVKKLLEQSNVKYILVGGTGLYLQSLCLGLSPSPPSDPKLRESLKQRYKNKAEKLYSDALKAKPNIEGKIMPGDTQRLLRVIELEQLASGGGEGSAVQERVGGIGPVPSVWLNFPRDELYRRINERVVKMLKNGWPEEVMELSKTVPINATAWQSIGYMELKNVLENGRNIFSIAEDVAIKTRHYAKRQITWFKHKENSVCIDGTNSKSEENIKRISTEFSILSPQ